MKIPRRLARIAIGLFFCWHVIAVGLYAIPTDTKDEAARFARFTLVKPFAPYIRITSQWQQWNLFSPDPLRRVPRYVVEVLERGQWKQVRMLDPTEQPWWSRSTHVKAFLGLLETDSGTYHYALNEQFVRSQCSLLNLKRRTPVRITTLTYVIPKPATLFAALKPMSWPPTLSATSTPTLLCP